MKLVYTENLDQVRVGYNVIQSGFRHFLHGGVITAVALFLVLGGKLFPVIGRGVEAPCPEKMDAPDHILKVFFCQNMFLEGNLVFQPVHFQPEQDFFPALAARLGGNFPHFTDIVPEMRGEPFTVFIGIVISQRTGRVFGKAVDLQPLPFACLVHFPRGTAAVGIKGMRVQVRVNH